MLEHEEIHKEIRIVEESAIGVDVRKEPIPESGLALLNKLIDKFISKIS